MKLPIPARAQLFTGMFEGDKESPCDKVTRTFFAGFEKTSHDAIWSIGCGDGHTYQMTIKADANGSTRLLSCDTLKLVARVECFKSLSE